MPGLPNIGPWTRLEQIGLGGNATVWKAHTGDPGNCVALKVLRLADSDDPYRRFASEIAINERLRGFPGVLPFISWHLPEVPTEEDAAWLAMPIAQGIRDALKGAPLNAIVRAIGEVADTLARLAAQHDVGHRDIKPGNPYRLDDRWLVGDFGLVHAPDLAELTRNGDRVGAVGYMPSEMLADPVNSDPKKADVYALCKTLWVLACDQRWPLIGFQPANAWGSRISDQRPQRRADQLDILVEAGTRIDPAARPSMEGVARELAAWLAPPEPVAGTLDLGGLQDRLRSAFARPRAEREESERRQELAYDARDRLQALLEPIYQQLNELSRGFVDEDQNDDLTRNYAGTSEGMGNQTVVWRESPAIKVVAGPDHDRYILRIGYCLELLEDGDLALGGLLAAGPEEYSGGVQLPIPQRRAGLGLPSEAAMLDDFVSDLRSHLPSMIEAYLRQIEGR